MARIGVAISGGGHRAAVWGWGALLALVDTGAHRDVVSVASVSGGSIANGVIANAGDLTGMSRSDAEAAVRRGLRVAARDGLFFFGPRTDRYVAGVLGLATLALGSLVGTLVAAVGAGRGWPLAWFLVVGPALAGAVLLLGRMLPFRLRLLLASAGLIAGPLTVLWLLITGGQHGWGVVWLAVPIAVTSLLVWSGLRVFGRRGVVVERALGADLLAREGRPTRLAEVDGGVHHVFCATELQAGDHCYLTPRVLYSYRVGVGRPGDAFLLSTAVQVSACLPGAFVPRELPIGALGFVRPWAVDGGIPPAIPPTLVLNDGGVYDNMADQWEAGFDKGRAGRLACAAGLQDGSVQDPADTLVVVNACKAWGWSGLGRTSTVGREMRGLTRTVDILYDVTTSYRRSALVDRFETGAARSLAGALVHIAQTPFAVPAAFEDRGGERGERAREALMFLRELGANEADWRGWAQASAAVPTVLGALGVEIAARLLQHAYWLTRINCYVVLGIGRLDDPASFQESRFVGLCAP